MARFYSEHVSSPLSPPSAVRCKHSSSKPAHPKLSWFRGGELSSTIVTAMPLDNLAPRGIRAGDRDRDKGPSGACTKRTGADGAAGSWDMQIHLPAVLCHFPSQSARAGLAQDALAPAGKHRREDGENSSISLISPVSIKPGAAIHPAPCRMVGSPQQGLFLHIPVAFSSFSGFIFTLGASSNSDPTHLLAAALKVGVLLGNLIRIRGENPFLTSRLSNELD